MRIQNRPDVTKVALFGRKCIERFISSGSIKVRRTLMRLENSLRVSVTSLPRRWLWRCRKATRRFRHSYENSGKNWEVVESW